MPSAASEARREAEGVSRYSERRATRHQTPGEVSSGALFLWNTLSDRERNVTGRLVDEALERGAMTRLVAPHLRAVPDLQAAARELGVEADLLAPPRVAVVQPHECFRGRGELGRDRRATVTGFERPPPGLQRRAGAGAVPQAPHGPFARAFADDDQRHPRRGERTHAHACGGAFEEHLGAVVEAGDLTPRIMVGVAAAPVVALTADPVAHLDRLAGDLQRAAEHGHWRRDERLGFGERAFVERLGEQEQRRPRARVVERPCDLSERATEVSVVEG